MGDRQTNRQAWSSSVLRLVCISDTHSQHSQLDLPPGDVLLHAGDFTEFGTKDQVEEFDQWLGQQNFKHKVVVPGNHDNVVDPFIRQMGGDAKEKNELFVERNEVYMDNVAERMNKNWKGEPKEFLKNAIVLVDDTVEIEGLFIFGSPHTSFNQHTLTRGGSHYSAYKYQSDAQFEERLTLMGRADIVMTHMPPYGIGDVAERQDGTVEEDNHIGSQALRKAVLREQPVLHMFGHIHEGRGVYKDEGVTWVNASNWVNGRKGEEVVIRQAMVIDIDRITRKIVNIIVPEAC
eukprot:GFUD01067904.1.p1 GENE.GFUD01067904.1~~GFUD01067904.1.p1  ORF type:complete len:291 (-),score=97.78 GFUD01067904.1:103-975(-)